MESKTTTPLNGNEKYPTQVHRKPAHRILQTKPIQSKMLKTYRKLKHTNKMFIYLSVCVSLNVFS